MAHIISLLRTLRSQPCRAELPQTSKGGITKTPPMFDCVRDKKILVHCDPAHGEDKYSWRELEHR